MRNIFLLLLSVSLLIYTWTVLNHLALNRGRGYPEWVSGFEATLWYSLPAIQFGILIGWSLSLAPRMRTSSALKLAIAAFSIGLLNVLVLLALLLGGAFLPIF